MKKSIFYAHLQSAAQQERCNISVILQKTRSLGYEGLEFDYAEIAKDVHGFQHLLKSHDFHISSVYSFQDFGHELDQHALQCMLDDLALLDCKKVMVIPGFLRNEATRDQELSRMTDALSFLCDAAKDRKIIITLEDFDDCTSPCATTQGLRIFMDQIPDLYFTFDTGNFCYSDEDALVAFESLKDRLMHVHLKDRSRSSLDPGESPILTPAGHPLYPAPVGSGMMPMKEYLMQIQKTGYDDFVTVEHFGCIRQWEAIQKSMNFLCSILA